MMRQRGEEVAALIQPMRVVGMRRRRIGRQDDGGYVVLDDLRPGQPIYSLGIGSDVSFDLDLAERGHDVFMYDHTVDGPPVAHPRFHFQKRAIDKGSGSLQSIIAENGHTGRDDLFMKMDIEHAEYEVVPATPPTVLEQFKQIVLELHWITDVTQEHLYPSIIATLRALRRSHHAVHIHANNYGETREVGGIPLPGCIELTLVRIRDYKFKRSWQYFPTRIDWPNNPEKPDIRIGRLGLGSAWLKRG